jgi:hypothetical protein
LVERLRELGFFSLFLPRQLDTSKNPFQQPLRRP